MLGEKSRFYFCSHHNESPPNCKWEIEARVALFEEAARSPNM